MAIVKMKPTSAGRRGMVCMVTEDLRKGASYTPLLEKKNSTAGHNNSGHITTRHKGGGHKHHYRVVDFKRNRGDIPTKVEHIKYDPDRITFITLLCYADGKRRYITAPRDIKAGAVLVSGIETTIKVDNILPIRSIPASMTIHCIEMKPGRGAQITRSVDASAVLLTKEGTYAQVRLHSSEVHKIDVDCRAAIGEADNGEQSLREVGKAGVNHWRGIRPAVRGVIINSVDHPHGDGEGRIGKAHEPVSPWDTPIKGYRTRNNKYTDNMIVRHRYLNKG